MSKNDKNRGKLLFQYDSMECWWLKTDILIINLIIGGLGYVIEGRLIDEK